MDDAAGVIVDVEVTTGEASEGKQLLGQIERVEANTGKEVETMTADGAYAHSENYIDLEIADIEAVIPPQRENRKPKRIPLRRFKYDGVHHTVRCPAGKQLVLSYRDEKGSVFRARQKDCCGCRLRGRCLSGSVKARTVRIVEGYTALLRARRRWPRRDERTRELYGRHRWRSEGVHGEAKSQHGLRRTVRRGLWNVAIQSYLTAAVMNLKRLAALLLAVLRSFLAYAATIAAPRPRQARYGSDDNQKRRPMRKAA